jgi:hypothetical protein
MELKYFSNTERLILMLILDGYSSLEISEKIKKSINYIRSKTIDIFDIIVNMGYNLGEKQNRRAKLISMFRRTDFEKKLQFYVINYIEVK